MAQNDFSIANQGFPSFRSDLNDALQSLASNSSGTTAPPTTYAYQWWYDETNDILKIRNSANDGWIDFATFDQTTGSWSFASVDIDGGTIDGTVIGGTTAAAITGTTGTFSGDVTLPSINGGPLSGFRNAIINGNFGINQRAVSGTVSLSAGDYGHDRWKAGSSGCTYTFSTSGNVTTITITSGSLVQVIEGANLFSGTYTLSFTGTSQGKIGAGSFGSSGITGSVTGGTDLSIEFNTGTVAQVQFEPGSTATPFERRPVGTELELCQRYYFQADGNSGGGLARKHTGIAVASLFNATITFPVTMRTVPSVSIGWTDFQNCTTSSSHFFGREGVTLRVDVPSAGVYRAYEGTHTFDAEL